VVIALMVAVITSLHYGTHIHHEPLHALYRKLYYLPILMSAFHFGFRGAMVCAFACTLLYLPHLHCDWGASYLIKNADRSLEVLLYLVIAAITGAYSSHQKKLHQALKQSHEDLKMRTESLVTVQSTLQKHEKLHAVGLLGAGISHEIRNPLASLKGILEIVLTSEKECTQNERTELGAIALKEVSRIQDILTRFLSLSREDSCEGSEVDLKGVCQNLIGLTKSQVKKKGIEASLALPVPDCIYYGPVGPVQQVILNLLLNALEMANKQVEVELIKLEAGYQIIVRDDGEGVKPGTEEAIFDFFYTTKQEGSGLGLAISAELMHKIGGSLSLMQNSNPTVFSLEFPGEIKLSESGKHKLGVDQEPQESQ
jgi:two-component system, NtrC family, sensor histidine kinase HydH